MDMHLARIDEDKIYYQCTSSYTIGTIDDYLGQTEMRFSIDTFNTDEAFFEEVKKGRFVQVEPYSKYINSLLNRDRRILINRFGLDEYQDCLESQVKLEKCIKGFWYIDDISMTLTEVIENANRYIKKEKREFVKRQIVEKYKHMQQKMIDSILLHFFPIDK